MLKKKYVKKNKKFMFRVSLFLCLALIAFSFILSLSEKVQASTLIDGVESLIDLNKEKKYKGARDEEELKVLPTVQNSEFGRKKSQESTEGF